MTKYGPACNSLIRHYEHQLESIQQLRKSARPCIAVTSNTVPTELIHAAGFTPIMLGRLPVGSPESKAWLEPLFESRIENIFSYVFDGHLADFAGFILPRTSEPEYKLFLYLTELHRQQKAGDFPEPYLFNLLHTRSETSYAYGLARTRELWDHLQQLSGSPQSQSNLDAAIAQSNRKRAAMRQLLSLRTSADPRLSGSMALALIGASYYSSPSSYISFATHAYEELQPAEPLPGIRVILKGAPLYYPTLHAAIEQSGGLVIAEDDWWGERAIGADIRTDIPPIEAIFEKYYFDAPSPRVFPPEEADHWFDEALKRNVQAVVFYIPPDDDVLGWDLPRHIQKAQNSGTQTLVIREEANTLELSPGTKSQIEQFLATIM